ncbi:MAG: diguanylate cyclase, partial [Rhodospirillaceae bacterium]
MNNDSRPSILVVEDDSAIRSLLNTVLGERWTVVTANTADDALKSASATVPDLILLDVGLPDADGLDVCRKLKVDPALTDIPVIFLTSHTSPKDEIAGLEAGGLDYIPKPINPAILRARLNNHMELKRSRDALARLAHNDGLTGLINRRTFDAVYNREWKRLARTHQCLSVIMIDVDHFKKYNDTYGHAAGDECLRRVARAAEGALQRPADIVARYGGEEFIALLPDTTL